MRARTSTEATTYMDLHGCACGANRFTRTRTLLQDGDRLLARYSGPCDGCGTVRSFTFELSDESPGAENSFGEGCSEILDAGEFTPADVPRLSADSSLVLCRRLVKEGLLEVVR